jgi:Ala-tRNA(Pro) deacylase
MPAKPLKEFLEQNHVKYLCIDHSPSFTAQEVAAAAHVSGRYLAKIVIVKIGSKLAMVVLPAHDHVNFADLKAAVGSNDINLASESEFKGQFPGCEVGAMPPFGNLYNVPVYASSHLSHDKMIFNSGSHSELVEMSYQDFERLVKPKIVAMH